MDTIAEVAPEKGPPTRPIPFTYFMWTFFIINMLSTGSVTVFGGHVIFSLFVSNCSAAVFFSFESSRWISPLMMEAFIRGCGLDPQSYVGFLQFQIIDFVMHGLPFLTSMIQLSQKTLFSSYEILTIFTTCATSLAVHFGWALLYAGDLDLTHVYCPDLVMQESKSRPAWNAMWFVAFLGHFFPVATCLLLNW